jgi:hypothetical protein
MENSQATSPGAQYRVDERRLSYGHPDDELAARISVRQLMRIYQIVGLAERGHDVRAALRDVQMFILAVAHESGTAPFGADITAAEAWADVARWELGGQRCSAPVE